MIIKFNWNRGWMELNSDFVLESMPMTNYRKWAKLFAQYGKTEQHTAFLQLVDDTIKNQEAECAKIEAEIVEWQAKADGRAPSVMSPVYLETCVKKCMRKLNGANRNLKRYKTMYEVLKGLVS